MKKESKCALWEYEECDSKIVEKMIDFLDKNYLYALNFFEMNLNISKITIHIFPTKEKYDNSIEYMWDENVPKWVVGNYINNSINYVSYNDYKNTVHANESFDYYLQTLLHEYTHFITDAYCKEYNIEYPIRYISEGIAYFISGQGNNIIFTDDLKIEDILTSKSKYKTWYLFVKYIIENFGKEFFMELLRNKKLAENKAIELINEANCFYKNFEKKAIK